MTKNNLKKIIPFLSFLFFIPIPVFATSGSLSFSGNNTVETGSKITINLVANASQEIITTGGKINASNNCLKIINIENISADVNPNNNIFTFLDIYGLKNITLAKITLEASKEVCEGYIEVIDGTLSFIDSTSLDNLNPKKTINVIKKVEQSNSYNNIYTPPKTEEPKQVTLPSPTYPTYENNNSYNPLSSDNYLKTLNLKKAIFYLILIPISPIIV